MKRLSLLLALLLCAPAVAQQKYLVFTTGGSTSGPSNSTSPLGVNLNSDTANSLPFLNILQDSEASQWGFGSTGLNGALTDLSLDSNYWPNSSVVGFSGQTYTDGIGLNVTNFFGTTSWTAFCNQGAVINVTVQGSGSFTCPAGSTVANAGSLNTTINFISITNDNPTGSGAHMTGLAIVPTAYASRYQQYLNGTCPACQFNPNFLSTDGIFRYLRDMDWQFTNFNTKLTSWASRPLPAQPFYLLTGDTQAYGNGVTIPWGMPVEVFTSLCNVINASCWYNIPLNATDNYLTNFASYISSNTTQPPFVEYTNEAWNTCCTVNSTLVTSGAAQFSTSPTQVAGTSYYTLQASHVMDTISANIGGRQFFRVLGLAANGNSSCTPPCTGGTNYIELGGTSYGNLWSGSNSPTSHFDVTAIAPYFAYPLPASWSADAAGLTLAFQEINSGGALPTGVGANTTTNSGNNFSLTSSSGCGAGAIPSTPANETVTCLKFNTAPTGNSTLKVDGGTQYPLYAVFGSSTAITQYQIPSSFLSANTLYEASFTSKTGSPAWSSSTTYSAGNFVSGSDGNTYISVGSSNLNHNPVGDGGVNWTAITPAWWVVFSSGYSGGMIAETIQTIISPTLTTISNLSVALPLVCYEGGQQFAEDNEPIVTILYQAINADSRMNAGYQSLYGQVKTAGLTGVCSHYNDIGAWNIFGSWGFSQNVNNAAIGKYQGLQAYINANPKNTLP